MTKYGRILESSPFLALCRRLREPAKFVFGGRKLRPLARRETEILISRGCHARDWTGVRVVEDFTPEGIFGCLFLGACVLGRFAGGDITVGGPALPPGLYFSTLRDAVVGDGALVHRCELVSRFVIDAGAAVCGSRLSGDGLPGDGGRPFGNGAWINAGIETGGRTVPLYADLDASVAERSARAAANGAERREIGEFLTAYAAEAALPAGYVGKKSRVVGTALVNNAFIGSDVVIEGAARIDGSTIIGSGEAPVIVGAGCVLDGAVLRPGCRADSQALVDKSFLAEAARAERQAKITESYIGPNSVVGEGEVTASFVGPFVGFHHQSLLIAAFWPGGRGNVGQGANVGSNHSSRMPDGEIWPAEGMFFGLGCNVKYPADYSASPYTIIATGVTTLPQKVEYPFSLIVQPDEPQPEAPPAFNRLVPAWVLSDNLYAVRRGEMKFAARNRVPGMVFDSDPFGPASVDLMENAVRMLRSAARKDVYLPEDIPGIGRNFLLERDRARAVDTYSSFIRFARLRNALAGCGSPGWRPPPEESPRDMAGEYAALLEKHFALILESRRKDHSRGLRIIPDYADTHTPPERDEVVLAAREAFDREIRRVREGADPR